MAASSASAASAASSAAAAAAAAAASEFALADIARAYSLGNVDKWADSIGKPHIEHAWVQAHRFGQLMRRLGFSLDEMCALLSAGKAPAKTSRTSSAKTPVTYGTFFKITAKPDGTFDFPKTRPRGLVNFMRTVCSAWMRVWFSPSSVVAQRIKERGGMFDMHSQPPVAPKTTLGYTALVSLFTKIQQSVEVQLTVEGRLRVFMNDMIEGWDRYVQGGAAAALEMACQTTKSTLMDRVVAGSSDADPALAVVYHAFVVHVMRQEVFSFFSGVHSDSNLCEGGGNEDILEDMMIEVPKMFLFTQDAWDAMTPDAVKPYRAFAVNVLHRIMYADKYKDDMYVNRYLNSPTPRSETRSAARTVARPLKRSRTEKDEEHVEDEEEDYHTEDGEQASAAASAAAQANAPPFDTAGSLYD